MTLNQKVILILFMELSDLTFAISLIQIPYLEIFSFFLEIWNSYQFR